MFIHFSIRGINLSEGIFCPETFYTPGNILCGSIFCPVTPSLQVLKNTRARDTLARALPLLLLLFQLLFLILILSSCSSSNFSSLSSLASSPPPPPRSALKIGEIKKRRSSKSQLSQSNMVESGQSRANTAYFFKINK